MDVEGDSSEEEEGEDDDEDEGEDSCVVGGCKVLHLCSVTSYTRSPRVLKEPYGVRNAMRNTTPAALFVSAPPACWAH